MEAVAGLGKAVRMAGNAEDVLSRQSVTANQDPPVGGITPTRAASPAGPAELPETSASGRATETHRSLEDEEAAVEVERFNLWYGQTQALFDVSMIVPKGKVTALIGPSGCGKSTLLRSVNRLNDLVEGVRVSGDMKLGGRSI